MTASHGVEVEQAPFESGQGHVVPVEVAQAESVEQIHSTFVPPPPMPEQVEVAAEPEFVEHVQEFEPTEGSASFRVDPVPPSEYRQSAPVETPEFSDAAEEHITPTHEAAHEAHEQVIEHEVMEHEEIAPEVVEHDVTSISATGEMHSEAPTEAAHELPAMEIAEPTAPIAHEGAVVEQKQVAAHFQPGDGHLEEEEMFDEEEEVLPSLHAQSGESFQHSDHSDHSEQETLEGVADLGTMLREMSIDQITRTEPTEGIDEDDLEEDFLEEDQDYDSASGEGEFEEEEGGEEGLSDEGLEGIEDAEYGKGFEGAHVQEGGEAAAPVRTDANVSREPRRDRDDRGRRDGRRGDRGRRDRGSDRGSDRGGDRNSERGSFTSPGAGSDRPERSSSDRGGSRDSRGGRGSRQSMQSTNLPAISELLKPGQEILCQIAKEPIAKKGARITSHIALPGRFLVFMPTVNHTGVSRKIESDGERRRLKEILLSEKGEASGGFIVRTAASGASEEELRSDLRFLLNLWADIKARSESSKSPALIYHDLNLVERVLRDQVTDTFSAIWVDTETEYERVLRFLQRFQPSLIRRVKLYTKETPLFEQFGITEEINKALRSKVWLKSGGSIVINQTEALVAIDINTGKFVGKTARLEDTIVKTNLDAIPEIVRQIRLRDLGGIIIIDFIDMDERKNRNKVMAALEEELKSDRAPSKVLQFNDFGLVAITRKRVKQSLERTLSTTCGVCAGTGMVKSPVTVCNDIYVEMRKMHKHLDRGDVMLRVHPEVVKQLKSGTSRWLQEMEEMCGKTILVKSDPSLHPEQFDIH